MSLHFVLLVSLASACHAASYFLPYNVYLERPAAPFHALLRQPAVYAPLPPSYRQLPRVPVAPLVHNYVTYNLDPDAEPEDAMEVAQFHSQDSAGRVAFGFNTPHQTRMEARALDGSVRGSYSYQDPTGKLVKMHYWDDGNGFHTVGNNLPVNYYSPPAYTPEVQAARERHLQLYKEALAAALATGTGPGKEEENTPSQSEVETQPDDSAVEVESADSPADQMSEDTYNNAPDYDADSDAVAIESAADGVSLRRGMESEDQGRADPEAARKQVAELQHSNNADFSSGLAIARTGVNGYQYLVPVAVPAYGQSESLQATLYGAIPVAAVHDAQVSPAQQDSVERNNAQLKPVLVRTGYPRVV